MPVMSAPRATTGATAGSAVGGPDGAGAIGLRLRSSKEGEADPAFWLMSPFYPSPDSSTDSAFDYVPLFLLRGDPSDSSDPSV
jgi:hypothetical protein